ncbi:MAG TPA: hypothetical protein VKB93_09370 [Thermoanaerobaculia bacterium]|nr:hypothetical protein [Thermoanaerobaculia bacterium]
MPLPKKGFRRADRVLAVSVLAVLGAGAANVNYAALWHRNTPAKQASVTMSQGSCALIDVGMPEAEVTRRLGAPDERAADEEARGPGAAVLLYKGPRCAVHLFEGRVESVD